MSKLGQVLVYDSNVDLRDKSPGGVGYQPSTLSNAGQFIGGVISGTNIHVVKSNGTPDENGVALKEGYEAAKNNVKQITNNEDVDTDVISYLWIMGQAGDLTQPFEIQDEVGYLTSNVFFKLNNYTNFSSGDEFTFIGSNGEKAVVAVSSFGGGAFSTKTLISGTPFALENVIRIDIAVSKNVAQTLLVAPGEYNVTSDGLLLDGAVNVISADYESSIIIQNGDVTYSGYSQSISNYTPVILGIDAKTNSNSFVITPDSKKAIFKKCKAHDNSFMDGDGSHQYHTFIECEAHSNAFASNGAEIEDCNFYDCKVREYGFFAKNAWGEDNNFYNCEAYRYSFLYQLNKTNNETVNGVNIEKCKAYSNSFIMDCGTSTSAQARIFNAFVKDCKLDAGGFGNSVYFTGNGRIYFKNCLSTEGPSFGMNSLCSKINTQYNIIFDNCFADTGFGTSNTDLDALYVNCVASGGGQSFQAALNITAKFINCVGAYGSGGNSYSVKANSNGGMLNCYTRDGLLFTE